MGLSAIRYPLDPTGTSPDNYVEGERHTLTPNRKVRVFCADYGAFFGESARLIDDATGQLLTKDQYFFDEMYFQPSDRYGKEIYAIVVIVDPTVSDNVTFSCQYLGGPYGTPVTAVVQQIEKINIDNRPVYWGDLLGKPEDGYPPNMHYHDAGDVYGFEYLVHVLERIRQAIIMGDSASHDVIYDVIDKLSAELHNLIAGQQDAINRHISREDNPHNVSATQLNCYTKPEIDQILTRFGNSFTQHVNNRENPHGVDAHQTGTYFREEIDRFLQEVQGKIGDVLKAHISNNKNPHGVTAAQIKAYTIDQVDALLASMAGTLDAHAKRIDNPHGVNKEQVKLGNVDNFVTATVEDHLIGVAANKFATPAGVTAVMKAHRESGDHDSRYVRIGQAVDSSIGINNGRIYIYAFGKWNQVFPALWS